MAHPLGRLLGGPGALQRLHAATAHPSRPTRGARRQRRVAARSSAADGPGGGADGDLGAWRKKAFGSKPDLPGSTRSPHQEDPIDAEWKALQRDRAAGAEPPSTSGRGEYGFSVEDSWDVADDAYTPFPPPPGSPPVSADAVALDAWAAARRMAASSELWNRVSQVYVILFGVGKTETEGIYSLRAVTGSEGLPVDTIIAFESSEDAERYAGLLEATMSRYVPKVCPIESRELLDFCADSGYNCRLEPAGSLLIPPEYNVGMTDWERSLRLRDGKYNVLDSDPEPGMAGAGAGGGSSAGPYEGPTLLNGAGAYFPTDSAQLEELKARLERLLP